MFFGSQRTPFLRAPPLASGCSTQIEFGIHTGNGASPNIGLHRGCSNAFVAESSVSANTWAVFSLVVLPSGAAPNNLLVFRNGAPLAVTTNAGGWLSPGGYPTGSAYQTFVGVRNDQGYGSSAVESFFVGAMGDIVILRTGGAYWRGVAEQELMAKYGIAPGAHRRGSSRAVCTLCGVGRCCRGGDVGGTGCRDFCSCRDLGPEPRSPGANQERPMCDT